VWRAFHHVGVWRGLVARPTKLLCRSVVSVLVLVAAKVSNSIRHRVHDPVRVARVPPRRRCVGAAGAKSALGVRALRCDVSLRTCHSSSWSSACMLLVSALAGSCTTRHRTLC
jgi:hypothetical protein